MQQILFLALVAVVGLAFGSFANVLIYRLCEEKAPKFWQGRSLCPHCHKAVSAKDNIPVVSFLILKGKCRHCHEGIGWHYPGVELLTAAVFVACFLLFPVSFGVLSPIALAVPILLASVSFSFIVIFFADLLYGLIPDEMVILSLFAGFLFKLLFSSQDLLSAAVVGGLTGLGFFLIVLATRFKGMGLGDVKLALVMGFLLGFPNILVALWIAFVSGGIVACALLLLKKTRLSATIPLGPFLVVGTLTAALWSIELLHLVGL